MKTRVIWGAVAVLWMTIIFSFSAAPAERSSKLSGGISYQAAKLINMMPFVNEDERGLTGLALTLDHPIRKLAHMTEYAVFAWILLMNCALYGKISNRRYLISWMLATLYAFTDEFHQIFSAGRSPQFSDVLIDSAGALAGLLVTSLVIKAAVKKRDRSKIKNRKR